MNEPDQNNIDKGEEHDKGGKEVQNQRGNNNNHAQISDDEGLYADSDNNKYDLNDNHQLGYDSTSDLGNEHNFNESDNDNDHYSNDIAQDEGASTTRRSNHNMSTRGIRLGNMAYDLPKANN